VFADKQERYTALHSPLSLIGVVQICMFACLSGAEVVGQSAFTDMKRTFIPRSAEEATVPKCRCSRGSRGGEGSCTAQQRPNSPLQDRHADFPPAKYPKLNEIYQLMIT